jgi:uncharacterized protein
MKHAWLGLAAGLAAGPLWGMAAAAPLPDSTALDCAKPISRVDRTICGNPALAAADRDVAALAAELAQRLQSPPSVQTAQQDWTQRRNRMCAPGYTPECLTIAYAEREAWLRARLATMAQAAPRPLPAASTATPPAAAIPPTPAAAQPAPSAASAAPVSARSAPAAPQPPNATPAAVTPPVPPAAIARPSAPQPLPPGQSLAIQLATAPCAAVNSNVVRGAGWAAGQAPFGMPFPQWTQQDFSALSTRIQECQAENGESLRNVQMLQAFLGSFRNSAPNGPSRPLAAATAAPPVPQRGGTPSGPPDLARLDCADQALLSDVVFIFQSQPGALARGNNVRRLSNPRPYTDVILEAYSATPTLRDEYRRLQPYMAPTPQCLVDAATLQGDIVLSYRLYVEGGRTLVEVRQVP